MRLNQIDLDNQIFSHAKMYWHLAEMLLTSLQGKKQLRLTELVEIGSKMDEFMQNEGTSRMNQVLGGTPLISSPNCFTKKLICIYNHFYHVLVTQVFQVK